MMLVLAIVEIFSVILQRIFCDSTLKKKKIRRYTDYLDRKSTRLNSSHMPKSRMPSSA